LCMVRKNADQILFRSTASLPRAGLVNLTNFGSPRPRIEFKDARQATFVHANPVGCGGTKVPSKQQPNLNGQRHQQRPDLKTQGR
jgi:hypothetical protein